MKWTLLILLLAFWPGSEPQLPEVAKQAYAQKEFRKAARLYEGTGNHWQEVKIPAQWNEAVSWLQADSLDVSMSLLANLSRSPEPEIRSRALTNRAVFLARQNKIAEALDMLRQALREFPENDLARYNYEVLRKPLPPPPPPPPDPEQENRQQKQQQNNPQKPKPTEQNGNRSENPILTQQEAERALIEMGKKEEQLLQQLRKKVKGKSERDGKPSW
ncbi:MAG: tetratricopeptide repeat protein [Bacteroidia bacterium]|nr:tetratricopeptide repeat protein [Bacteroidia bacterium]